MRPPAPTIALAMAALVALATAPLSAAQRVVTIEGRTVEGTVLSIDARRVVVKVGDQAQPIAREDVLAVALNEAPSGSPGEEPPAAPTALMDQPGRQVLVAHDGTCVGVEDVRIADGTLRGRAGAFDHGVAVPLDRIAYLLRPGETERPSALQRRCATLRLPQEAKDHVVVAKDGGPWVPLAGIVKALDANTLAFRYDDTDALLEAGTVRVIQFARTGQAPPKPGGHVTCLDGSRIAFTAIELAGKEVRLPASPTFGQAVTLAADQVAAIRFVSDRLTYLGDLEPVEAACTGFFDTAVPWRRDRACDGGPIRLGGVTYEKGLGLHSRTELAFDLDGRYRRFMALAGIDDAVRTAAAYLTVTGDARTLLEKTRLSRADPPKSLRLDVAGVKRLVILVDFAEGAFGVAERVDLADAKLIK